MREKISDLKEMLKRLRLLRSEKNYEQLYMAQQLGIDMNTYIEKEKGLAAITTKEWLKISDILEVKLLYFLKENV